MEPMPLPRPDRQVLPSYRPLAATFVTLALVYGVWYAYSVFLVALLQDFGWSRSVLAGAFSVFTLVHGGLGPPLGWLAGRLGPRWVVLAGGLLLGGALLLDGAIAAPWHLYLAFGLLTALGVATAGWVPAVILVQRWFPQRIGTALGVTSAGIGFGIFLVVPLCQWLIDHLGWRWAFRAMGVLIAAWVVPATLWLVRDSPAASAVAEAPALAAEPADPAEDLTLGRAIREARFWLLGTLQGCVALTNQMLLVHQVAYLVDHGIPPLSAAAVVGVIGLASVAGKVGGGWMSDVLDRRVVYTLGMALVSASIAALGLLALHPMVALAFVYAILLGVGYGIPAAITPAVISDAFRTRHFGAIFGTLQVANAIGGSLGPWIAGHVFDATGGYAPAFALGIISAVAATGALWGARRPTGPEGRPRG
jgi:MFS family permease